MKFAKSNVDVNECQTTTYARAEALLNEKREMLERLNEINRELRILVIRNSDAVAAARTTIPIRKPPGRKKLGCAA